MMEAISIQDMARVVDYLDKINDPRRTAYGNIRHKLLGACGTLEGSTRRRLFR
ncbi:MAG: hypothetical protein LBQ88_06930 [Treponema sp.]|jgi:hypothetical protein|nr:hypothetical protein [Treponema sp.]